MHLSAQWSSYLQVNHSAHIGLRFFFHLVGKRGGHSEEVLLFMELLM
jgi:hypothetical protein